MVTQAGSSELQAWTPKPKNLKAVRPVCRWTLKLHSGRER